LYLCANSPQAPAELSGSEHSIENAEEGGVVGFLIGPHMGN
jgi:hypothetical protein